MASFFIAAIVLKSLRSHTLRQAPNFAAGARNLDVRAVGKRKDGIARAAVVRALRRLAEQRGVAVRVAVGKDNGEAVCGQGGGAQRVEVAGDEDEGRVIRHGGFGRIRQQRQHLLCEVVDVGGAGEQGAVAVVWRVAEVGGSQFAEGLQGGGSVVAVGMQGEAVAVARL